MLFQADCNEIITQCEFRINEFSRKEDIERLESISDMVNLARRKLMVYCLITEDELKLLYGEK